MKINMWQTCVHTL